MASLQPIDASVALKSVELIACDCLICYQKSGPHVHTDRNGAPRLTDVMELDVNPCADCRRGICTRWACAVPPSDAFTSCRKLSAIEDILRHPNSNLKAKTRRGLEYRVAKIAMALHDLRTDELKPAVQEAQLDQAHGSDSIEETEPVVNAEQLSNVVGLLARSWLDALPVPDASALYSAYYSNCNPGQSVADWVSSFSAVPLEPPPSAPLRMPIVEYYYPTDVSRPAAVDQGNAIIAAADKAWLERQDQLILEHKRARWREDKREQRNAKRTRLMPLVPIFNSAEFLPTCDALLHPAVKCILEPRHSGPHVPSSADARRLASACVTSGASSRYGCSNSLTVNRLAPILDLRGPKGRPKAGPPKRAADRIYRPITAITASSRLVTAALDLSSRTVHSQTDLPVLDLSALTLHDTASVSDRSPQRILVCGVHDPVVVDSFFKEHAGGPFAHFRFITSIPGPCFFSRRLFSTAATTASDPSALVILLNDALFEHKQFGLCSLMDADASSMDCHFIFRPLTRKVVVNGLATHPPVDPDLGVSHWPVIAVKRLHEALCTSPHGSVVGPIYLYPAYNGRPALRARYLHSQVPVTLDDVRSLANNVGLTTQVDGALGLLAIGPLETDSEISALTGDSPIWRACVTAVQATVNLPLRISDVCSVGAESAGAIIAHAEFPWPSHDITGDHPLSLFHVSIPIAGRGIPARVYPPKACDKPILQLGDAVNKTMNWQPRRRIGRSAQTAVPTDVQSIDVQPSETLTGPMLQTQSSALMARSTSQKRMRTDEPSTSSIDSHPPTCVTRWMIAPLFEEDNLTLAPDGLCAPFAIACAITLARSPSAASAIASNVTTLHSVAVNVQTLIKGSPDPAGWTLNDLQAAASRYSLGLLLFDVCGTSPLIITPSMSSNEHDIRCDTLVFPMRITHSGGHIMNCVFHGAMGMDPAEINTYPYLPLSLLSRELTEGQAPFPNMLHYDPTGFTPDFPIQLHGTIRSVSSPGARIPRLASLLDPMMRASSQVDLPPSRSRSAGQQATDVSRVASGPTACSPMTAKPHLARVKLFPCPNRLLGKVVRALLQTLSYPQLFLITYKALLIDPLALHERELTFLGIALTSSNRVKHIPAVVTARLDMLLRNPDLFYSHYTRMLVQLASPNSSKSPKPPSVALVADLCTNGQTRHAVRILDLVAQQKSQLSFANEPDVDVLDMLYKIHNDRPMDDLPEATLRAAEPDSNDVEIDDGRELVDVDNPELALPNGDLPPQHRNSRTDKDEIIDGIPADRLLRRALKALRPTTAPGPTGITASFLQKALKVDPEAVTLFLRTTARLLLAGGAAQKCLIESVCIPIPKVSGNGQLGVRPLVVGEIPRRIVCSALMHTKAYRQQIRKALPLTQRSRDGCPSLVYAALRALEEESHNILLQIDGSAAFPNCSRKLVLETSKLRTPVAHPLHSALYANPTQMYYKQHSIPLTKGVSQGCPTGCDAFALGNAPLIELWRKQLHLQLTEIYCSDQETVDAILFSQKAPFLQWYLTTHGAACTAGLVPEDISVADITSTLRRTHAEWTAVIKRGAYRYGPLAIAQGDTASLGFIPGGGELVDDVSLLGHAFASVYSLYLMDKLSTGSGYHINFAKTAVTCSSIHLESTALVFSPLGIKTGLVTTFLGVPVSADLELIKQALNERLHCFVIPQLTVLREMAYSDPQVANYLALRHVLPRVTYLAQCLGHLVSGDSWQPVDDAIDSLLQVIVSPHSHLSRWARLLLARRPADGGAGYPILALLAPPLARRSVVANAKLTAIALRRDPVLYAAMIPHTWATEYSALSQTINDKIEQAFRDVPDHVQAPTRVLLCTNGSTWASDVWRTLPFCPLERVAADVWHHRMSLAYHPRDDPTPDPLLAKAGMTARSNEVNATMLMWLRQYVQLASNPVREPPLQFPTRGLSDELQLPKGRRVLPKRGDDDRADYQILVGHRSYTFDGAVLHNIGRAKVTEHPQQVDTPLREVETTKTLKYAGRYATFVPVVVSTVGAIGPSSERLLRRLCANIVPAEDNPSPYREPPIMSYRRTLAAAVARGAYTHRIRAVQSHGHLMSSAASCPGQFSRSHRCR